MERLECSRVGETWAEPGQWQQGTRETSTDNPLPVSQDLAQALWSDGKSSGGGAKLPGFDPGLPLTNCVTMGKLHNLSVPRCFHLHSGDTNRGVSQSCCEDPVS